MISFFMLLFINLNAFQKKSNHFIRYSEELKFILVKCYAYKHITTHAIDSRKSNNQTNYVHYKYNSVKMCTQTIDNV